MRVREIKFNLAARFSTVVFTLIAAMGVASAQSAPSHIPSKADIQKMQSHNFEQLQKQSLQGWDVQRTHTIYPYAEYNEAGYLIMSADEDFNSSHIKKALIENLPEGMTAIIYTDAGSASQAEYVFNKFARYAKSKDQIRIVSIPNSYRGFWARDAIPVPVWKKQRAIPMNDMDFGVVNARYYHRFEPDQFFAEAFQASMTSFSYYYEGGNFVPNSKGDCLVVNKVATQDIPDEIFLNHYGCTNLVRLAHLVGIGHADEVVKFVSDDHVLTDQHAYKRILESKGFKVTMLPEAAGEYETYVNSLIIGDKVFVPVFNRGSDTEAIRTYESLGFKVVALNSSTLSNQGAGSIHCITMTYPKDVTYDRVIDVMAGRDITPSVNSSPTAPETGDTLSDTPQNQDVSLEDTESHQGGSWWDWLLS
ncbi:MAG: agmatine deiminase family protein [Bdellovibrionaceae bacterium]|nr:agmatine deiminase family protein [Pseudobdellovibrionaceae bacterium]